MSRETKGPRLELSQKREGRAVMWNIRDGQRTRGTGCLPDERGQAEVELAKYILEKSDPKKKAVTGDLNSVKVADCLTVYMDEKVEAARKKKINHKKTEHRNRALIKQCENLSRFFGRYMVGEVTGRLQRDYVDGRGSQSAARREVEILSAAINFFVREKVGGLQLKFRPVLPDACQARERCLTRSEAARLVRAAWFLREDRGDGVKGRYTSKHIARFILVGLYTGTRASAICGASVVPAIGRGYVNLETGFFRRLAYGEMESNKKQPTVPIPDKLLGHMRRWKRVGISNHSVIEWNGKAVERVSKGWTNVVKAAGLEVPEHSPEGKVIPHTLRHTAISWYLQKGMPPHKVSDYCGVSEHIIRTTYKHYMAGSFDEFSEAANSFGRTDR